MTTKNVLFLYTELAGYTVNCMSQAMLDYPSLQIHVIRWKAVNEAPFQFDFKNLKVYNRDEYEVDDIKKYVIENDISTIICSGWVDKTYVKVCKYFKNKIPTVLAIDNQWDGGVKQRVAQVLSPILIKRNFTHAWVPGNKQFEFVKKLGIAESNIKKGFYVANLDLFKGYYKLKTESLKGVPKRFLYVGRYVEHKGIYDLWDAFIQLQKEVDTDWELWCVGVGEEFKNRINHSKIKHLGFLQPQDFNEVIKKTSVYILPSHFEPWGVSVQEFAAAGYPLLLSNKIGASEAFLKVDENGFEFKSGEVKDIIDSFKKVLSLTENELIDMQLKSIQLSLSITTKEWSDSLMSFKL